MYDLRAKNRAFLNIPNFTYFFTSCADKILKKILEIWVQCSNAGLLICDTTLFWKYSSHEKKNKKFKSPGPALSNANRAEFFKENNLKKNAAPNLHMNYYAGPWDYVEDLPSPWRTPRRSPSYTQKQNSNMSWQTRPSRCEFRAQKTATELKTRESESVHGTRNERVESVTTCWGSVFECGMGIGVRFFTETASFLRNPRVPRNSSYIGAMFNDNEFLMRAT